MRAVYLLDTNVISELSKPCPNAGIVSKLAEKIELCAICSVVWQESVQGYEKMPEGSKKRYVAECLNDAKESYEILPYDSFASQICGELRARCEKDGTPVPYCDSQIAATAIANNMILITHNTADFAPLVKNSMLKVEDWWEQDLIINSGDQNSLTDCI